MCCAGWSRTRRTRFSRSCSVSGSTCRCSACSFAARISKPCTNGGSRCCCASAACICSLCGPGTSCISTRWRVSSCCRYDASRTGICSPSASSSDWWDARHRRLSRSSFPGFSWTGLPGGYADSDILLRQQISESGDYFGLVGNFFEWVVVDYLASGMIFGWLVVRAWPLPHRRLGRAAPLDRARPRIPAGMAARARLVSANWIGRRSGGGHALGGFMGARLGAPRVFRRMPASVCGASARDWLRGGVGSGVRGRARPCVADAVRCRGPHGAN